MKTGEQMRKLTTDAKEKNLRQSGDVYHLRVRACPYGPCARPSRYATLIGCANTISRDFADTTSFQGQGTKMAEPLNNMAESTTNDIEMKEEVAEVRLLADISECAAKDQ